MSVEGESAAEELVRAAEGRLPDEPGGSVRTALANAMVGLKKQYYGKGPTAAKARRTRDSAPTGAVQPRHKKIENPQKPPPNNTPPPPPKPNNQKKTKKHPPPKPQKTPPPPTDTPPLLKTQKRAG